MKTLKHSLTCSLLKDPIIFSQVLSQPRGTAEQRMPHYQQQLIVLQWSPWALQGLWMVQSFKITLKREQGIPATEALLTDLGERSPSLQLQSEITPQSTLIPLGCTPTKHKPGSASPGWGAQGSAAQDTQLLLQQLRASSLRLILGLYLRGSKIDAFQHTQPISVFLCHHKEPGIVCPLEHRTNAHLTFPCHMFWVSTSPWRGSRTPIHTAPLTKSCWVTPGIRPHESSHQCSLQSLLTWDIHLCLVHCLLLMIPNPLPYCLKLTGGTPRQQLKGTEIYQHWRFPTPLPISTSRCNAAAGLSLPSPIPTHAWATSHSSNWCSQEPGCSQGVARLHGKKGFFTSNEAQKNWNFRKIYTFHFKKLYLKNLELLNPQYFRDKAILLMKPFLLKWVVWEPPYEGFPFLSLAVPFPFTTPGDHSPYTRPQHNALPSRAQCSDTGRKQYSSTSSAFKKSVEFWLFI